MPVLPQWGANKWCFENGLADSPVEHDCCLAALHDQRSNSTDPLTVTKVCATTEGEQNCNIMYPAPTPSRVDQIKQTVHQCSLAKLGKLQHKHSH